MLLRIGIYFEVFIIITISMILLEIENKKYSLLLVIVSVYVLRYISFFINPLWSEHYNNTILSL